MLLLAYLIFFPPFNVNKLIGILYIATIILLLICRVEAFQFLSYVSISLFVLTTVTLPFHRWYYFCIDYKSRILCPLATENSLPCRDPSKSARMPEMKHSPKNTSLSLHRSISRKLWNCILSGTLSAVNDSVIKKPHYISEFHKTACK